MKCKHCGCETPNNSNYCSHCGEPVDFEDSVFETSGNIYENYENQKEEKVDKKYYDRYREEDLSTSNHPASIGWFYLGLLMPIVGFVLYYIYCYKKPDLARKARQGAIYGLIIDLVLMAIELMMQFM